MSGNYIVIDSCSPDNLPRQADDSKPTPQPVTIILASPLVDNGDIWADFGGEGVLDLNPAQTPFDGWIKATVIKADKPGNAQKAQNDAGSTAFSVRMQIRRGATVGYRNVSLKTTTNLSDLAKNETDVFLVTP